MKPLNAFLLFFACFYCVNSTTAQLKIHKDHTLDTYGLKNNTNKWVISPTFINISLLRVKQKTFYQVQNQEGLYGIIKLDGTLLIPPKYTSVSSSRYAYLILIRDGKEGIANLEGKIIVPVKYIKIEPTFNGCIVQTDDGKYGFYNPQGKLVLPTIYDAIRLTPKRGSLPYYHSSYYLKVWQGDKIGIFNLSTNRFLIPINYDEIDLLDNRAGSNIFLIKKEGKYGLLNPWRNIKPKYTKYAWPSTIDFVFFYNSDQIIAYNLRQEREVPIKTKLLNNSTLLLTTNTQTTWQEAAYYVFKRDTTDQNFYYSNYSKVQEIGNFLFLGNSTFRKKDTSYQLEKRFKRYEELSFGVYTVSTSDNKVGIFNFISNRFIVPPVNSNRIFTRDSSWQKNLLWLEEQEGFVLFDTLGNRRLNDYFHLPFFNHSTYPRVRNGNIGKLNPSTLQWIIPPLYKNIYGAIDEKVHLVQTRSNKYGLVSGIKDSVLVDTIYTSCMQHLDLANTPHFHQVLFDTNHVPTLCNEKGLQAQNIEQIKQYFYKRFEYDNWLFYLDNPNTISTQELQNQEIEPSFIASLLHVCHSDFRPNDLEKLTKHNTDKWYPSIEMLNQHSYVFRITHQLTSNLKRDDFAWMIPSYQYEWLNYTFFEGRVQQVHIKDVFGTSAILEKELLEAIQNSEYLNFDCSNISDRRIALGEDFALSEQGVYLYLPNNQNTNMPYSFLVPWKNLLKYPETRVLTQQFLDPLVLESILNTFKRSQTAVNFY